MNNTKIRLRLPIILSAVSSIGIVATAIVSAKDSKKKFESNKTILDENKSKFEVIKDFCKTYGRTILCAGLTITATVSSTIISKKNEMSLIATAGMLSAGWKKYENKVKEVIGKAKNDEILESIAKDDSKKQKIEASNDGKKLYWEKHVGFFRANETDVIKALSTINERINCGTADGYSTGPNYGTATIKDFLVDARATLVNDEVWNMDDLKFGWECEYLANGYDNYWVHGYIVKPEEENANYEIIEFSEEAIYDPENYDNYVTGLLTKEEYFDGKKDEFVKKGYIDNEESLYK